MATGIPVEQDAEYSVMAAIQQGDRQALDELVARHGRWVRAIVYAQLGDAAAADDVLQHVWLRVWQQASTVRDVRAWRGWLASLARNAAYDEARRRERERGRLCPDDRAALDTVVQPSSGPDAAAQDRSRRVMQAIAGLPAIYREPLVLRHLEDWSYRQIADVLGIPPDTVETRLVRARRLLRDALGAEV